MKIKLLKEMIGKSLSEASITPKYKIGAKITRKDTGQSGKIIKVYKNGDGTIMGYEVMLNNNSIVDLTPELEKYVSKSPYHESFNIDRSKNIVGQEVYDAIGKSNKQQLEKWLNDLKKEMQRESPGSTRLNKLQHEEQLIKARLGIKESNLREVSDFKIDGSSLKQYQSAYPNFKFSTDTDMYGNKQLVADVPKRKQEIKFYVWNGKINAQVTNGGLSNYATLDAALDHLYRQYGTTAPSYKQMDKLDKFNSKKK